MGLMRAFLVEFASHGRLCCIFGAVFCGVAFVPAGADAISALGGRIDAVVPLVLAQVGTPCETPGDCDDNDPCNGEEQCNLGQCALGPPPTCDDDNPCTDDFCQAGIGCRNEPNQASCSDGNPCNGDETCGGRTCRSGTPPNCADGNDCTLDTCNPELGCIHPPSSGPCEAGGCVTNGQCQEGSCVGEPLCDEECATCEAGVLTSPYWA